MVTVQMSSPSSTGNMNAFGTCSSFRPSINYFAHSMSVRALGSKIKFTPEADINGYSNFVVVVLFITYGQHVVFDTRLTPVNRFGSNNHFPLHISQWSIEQSIKDADWRLIKLLRSYRMDVNKLRWMKNVFADRIDYVLWWPQAMAAAAAAQSHCY